MNRFESRLTSAIESIMAILLCLVFVIVVTLVVMRYVFNASITGANEMMVILFVYATVLGAAVGLGKREHLSVDFLFDKLPVSLQLVMRRIQLGLLACLNLVALVLSIYWIKQTGDYLMPSTGLPRWMAQLSIPLGTGLAVFYCLLRIRNPNGTKDYHEAASDDGGES